MKFKDFLVSKGVSDESFGKMEAVEQAKLHGEFLDAIAKSLEEKAQSTDLALIKASVEELKNTGVSTETIKSLQDKLDGLAVKLAEFEENGGNATEKGTFIKFLEREERKDLEGGSNSKTARMDQFTFKAAALMTTANVIPNVTGGFNQLFGNYIDSTIHETPKPDTFILDLVTVTTQKGTENIWYVQRKNEEGDAAFIGEGDAKPLADAEWIESKAPIKEVAIFWKMSNRLMKHAPAVVDNFKKHANELVDQKIDDGVLTGAGTGNLLTGIATVASPFVVPTALSEYYADANIYDVINATATYVRLNNFKGMITVVLNTVWEAQMKGIKNTQGDYIVPPFVTPDGRNVSGMRVIFANKMPAAKILVGDLKRFHVVFDEDVQYYEGYENDDFSKNLVSKKIETFANGYVKQTERGAIIYDEISSILTDIEVVTP